MISAIVALLTLASSVVADDAKPITPAKRPIFEFTEQGGYTYSLGLQNIQPGHTAQLISQGFMAGKVSKKAAAGDDVPMDIADLFAFQIANDAKDVQELKSVHADVEKKNAEIPANPSPIVTPVTTTVSVPQNVIDWKQFESCAQKSLPLLREAITFQRQMKKDPEAGKMYYLVKSLLEDVTTAQGFVCGVYLRPDLEIRVVGDIRNVKVIGTLLNRSEKDRNILLRTLATAFSNKAPASSKNLFTYYFAEQFFTAGLTQEPVPSYATLDQKLAQEPEVRPLPLVTEKETINHTVKIQIEGTDNMRKQGEVFWKEIGL